MANYKNDVSIKEGMLVTNDQWIVFKLEHSVMQTTTIYFSLIQLPSLKQALHKGFCFSPYFALVPSYSFHGNEVDLQSVKHF